MTPVRQRILQRTTAVLSYLPVNSDGELSAADSGTVTVTVTRADGTALYTDAATGGAGANARTLVLTVTDTALLDVLTATWKVAGVTIAVTEHAIVGGYYFTIAELRAAEPSVQDEGQFPTAKLTEMRAVVEASFESWTNFAWVPRFSVVELSPTGLTEVFEITAVRWVRNYSDNTTYTSLTAAELLLLQGTGWGAIDGAAWWTSYYRRLAGVEHGALGPPPDLKRAAIRYCRFLQHARTSSIPQQAASMALASGGQIQFRRAGTEWSPTGIEEIDEVLRRQEYDHRLTGVG